jgi:hypothetical protein
MVIEPDWLNKSVDRGENKGYIIQADQVRYVHRGTVVALTNNYFYGATEPRGPGHHDHTLTHHTRYDFSGRAVSPMKTPLHDNTRKIPTYKPPRDSNPLSQQASGHRRRGQWMNKATPCD